MGADGSGRDGADGSSDNGGGDTAHSRDGTGGGSAKVAWQEQKALNLI